MSYDLILVDEAGKLPGRIELTMRGRWQAAVIHEPDIDFVTDIVRREHKVHWKRRAPGQCSPLAQGLDFLGPRTHSYRFCYGRFTFSASGSDHSTCVDNGRGERLGCRLVIRFGFLEIDYLWRFLNDVWN